MDANPSKTPSQSSQPQSSSQQLPQLPKQTSQPPQVQAPSQSIQSPSSIRPQQPCVLKMDPIPPNIAQPPTTITLPALNLTQVQQAPLALLKPIKYICCLLENGIRCDRVAGNASFSAKIQKIVATKCMNIALDRSVRHTYICEHHKAIITVAKKATTQNNKVAYPHVNLASGGGDIASSSDVDLQQLQVNTLRRYKRHFRVQTRPGLNKMQLAESLKGHFKTMPIIEKEAITYFVYIVKCYRNKLDHD